MSTTLAMDESPLAKLLNTLEESLFGVLFHLQKTRKEDLVRINYLTGLASIALDFIQLVPFFVHGKIISFKLFFKKKIN
jgi:hypothetical protein